MDTRSVVRAAVALAGTLFVTGMSLPASAAGEEHVAIAGSRSLTINGRPLSQLLDAVVTTAGAAPVAGLSDQGHGLITGVALDTAGQPLVDHAVELRSWPERATATPVVTTTTTDADGRFSFPGLRQGRYVVDVRTDHRVVATSGPIALAQWGMTFAQVGGVARPLVDRKGKGALFWSAVGAGIGGAVGLVAVSAKDCLPEDLCPLVPLGGIAWGALAGFFLGS